MFFNMALQRIFRPEYVNYLVNNIDVNSYLQDSFPTDLQQTQRLNGIEQPEGLEEKMLEVLDPKNKFESAILLYEAYSTISPLLASKNVLWTYLAHADLFNFVKTVWPEYATKKDGTPKSENESKIYIRNHWFYSSNGPMRTSLMNLWWSVYLTIDNSADEDHKYDLTKLFFLNDGLRTRRLGTGQLGRNREALKGILRFMKDNISIFDEGGIENRMIWITRHFNFIGGAKPLGCMSNDFFYNELTKYKEHLISIKKREDVTGPNAFV